MKNLLTLIGLLMTALGAWLLWKFGLPASIDREGAVHIVTEAVDEEEKKKAKRYDCVAGSGFLLIIAGSLLQGVALYVDQAPKVSEAEPEVKQAARSGPSRRAGDESPPSRSRPREADRQSEIADTDDFTTEHTESTEDDREAASLRQNTERRQGRLRHPQHGTKPAQAE